MNTARVRMKSRVLFMSTEITVLLPEACEKGMACKVLWLLHGAGGDNTEWLYGSHLTKYLRGHNQTMVVMPTALNSDYGSYPEFGTGYDFPKFFFEELMPFIYATFPASSEPEDNFIAGASMGGYGAMSLGLRHPEKFGGIAAFGSSMRESGFLEPYADMTGHEFRELAMKNRKEFPTEYGNPAEGMKPKEINVIAKYPTVRDFLNSYECMWRRFPEALEKGNLPKMYFAVGTEDLFYEPVKRFKAYADELGADQVEYDFVPGFGHSGKLWDMELEKVIRIFGI